MKDPGVILVAEALMLSRHYAGSIRLLLSDIIMPQMDGVRLAAEISGSGLARKLC